MVESPLTKDPSGRAPARAAPGAAAAPAAAATPAVATAAAAPATAPAAAPATAPATAPVPKTMARGKPRSLCVRVGKAALPSFHATYLDVVLCGASGARPRRFRARFDDDGVASVAVRSTHLDADNWHLTAHVIFRTGPCGRADVELPLVANSEATLAASMKSHPCRDLAQGATCELACWLRAPNGDDDDGHAGKRVGGGKCADNCDGDDCAWPWCRRRCGKACKCAEGGGCDCGPLLPCGEGDFCDGECGCCCGGDDPPGDRA
ncbi:hypothetical protein M885DRAFT_549019 [Pelagophyceae sp. CCMP2097]|nr:hypothetical protein M885DRAFT_549019 [Pelagophyceae sp. CCMP2097]